MKLPPLLLLVLLFSSGCVLGKYGGKDGASGAYDGVAGVNPQASASIARHAAGHLSAIYPPGRTTLSFDSRTHFGEALEDAARKRGFSISSGGLTVGYTLDLLSPESCYLSLILPDGVITQSFTLNAYSEGNAAVPDYTCTKTGLLAFSELSCRPPTDDRIETVAALPEPLAASAPAVQAGSPPSVLHEPIPSEAALAAPAQIAPKPETIPARQAAAAAATPPAAETVDELEPAETPLSSIWLMRPGLLRPQLEAWADSAGYSVVWKAGRDFEMETEVQFEEDFVSMLRSLFLQMHRQGTPLRVTVHQGNNVVEITEE